MTTTNHFRVLAVGRGLHTDQKFCRVEYREGRRCRRKTVSARDLASKSSAVMADLVLFTAHEKDQAQEVAQTALREMEPTFRVVERSGLFDRTFVWPTGETSGDARVHVSLSEAFDEVGSAFRAKGTLAAWQEIPRLARGHTRVMLALALAFTGPVAELLGWEAPMIQLVGEAGVFKSSILNVVASVWDNEVLSWNATASKAEMVALRHSGTLLVLDDLRLPEREAKADYFVLRDMVRRIADGHKKDRLTEVGQKWCTPVLSAANATLDNMARRVGVAIDTHQVAARGRLNDVLLANGGKETFEGCRGDPLKLVMRMGEVAAENRGFPAEAFLDRMLAWRRRDEDGLKRWLTDRRNAYLKAARHRFGSGVELTRVHMRKAVIYAAGCLAIRLGVLPWDPRELFDAIMTCEQSHLELWASLGVSTAIATPSAAGTANSTPEWLLRRHFARHRHQFVDLRKGLLDPAARHDHAACPGYINRTPSGTTEVLFSAAMLERICGGKEQVVLLKRYLEGRSWLNRDKRRPTVKRFIFRGHRDDRLSVVAIQMGFFEARRNGPESFAERGPATRRREGHPL